MTSFLFLLLIQTVPFACPSTYGSLNAVFSIVCCTVANDFAFIGTHAMCFLGIKKYPSTHLEQCPTSC